MSDMSDMSDISNNTDSIQSLANLALHPAINPTSLDTIALALRPQLPRWEEIADKYSEAILLGDPQESLPVYCFNCGRIRAAIIGGYIRDSCNECCGEGNNTINKTSYPSHPLSSTLWSLFSATGYPIEVWRYILLRTLKLYPRRCHNDY